MKTITLNEDQLKKLIKHCVSEGADVIANHGEFPENSEEEIESDLREIEADILQDALEGDIPE